MKRQLLFPIDGSVPCQKTLNWAVEFFSPDHNEIALYTVVERPLDEVPDSHEIEKQNAVKNLDASKAFFQNHGFTVTSSEFSMGDPVTAICQYAEEIQADSILMGSHGRTSFLKLLFGSISSGVFEKAKIPVMMVKNT